MRVLFWATLLAALLVISAEAKRKRKFEGDFEFAEEVSAAPKTGPRKLSPLRWPAPTDRVSKMILERSRGPQWTCRAQFE